MKEENDNYLDGIFRKGLEAGPEQIAYNSDDWAAMEKMLGQGKKPLAGGWLWPAAILGIAMLAVVVLGWLVYTKPYKTTGRNKQQRLVLNGPAGKATPTDDYFPANGSPGKAVNAGSTGVDNTPATQAGIHANTNVPPKQGNKASGNHNSTRNAANPGTQIPVVTVPAHKQTKPALAHKESTRQQEGNSASALTGNGSLSKDNKLTDAASNRYAGAGIVVGVPQAIGASRQAHKGKRTSSKATGYNRVKAASSIASASSTAPANSAGNNTGFVKGKMPVATLSSKEQLPGTTENQEITEPLYAMADTVDKPKPKQTVINPVDSVIPAAKAPGDSVGKSDKWAHTRKPLYSLAFIFAPDINGVNNYKDARWGNNLGGQASINWFRVNFTAGAVYSRKPYVVLNKDYKTSYVFPVRPTTFDATCLMWDVYTNLSYQLAATRRSKLFAGAGITSYLMKSEDYIINYENPDINPPRNYKVPKSKDYWFSIANLFVTYEYALTPKIGLLVQPYAKVPVKGVGNSTIKLQSAGVAFGLNWNINGKAVR